LSAVNNGVVGDSSQQVYATPAQALSAAESHLAALRSQYGERHPDVRRLLRQVNELKAEVAEGKVYGSTGAGDDAVQNIDTARIQARINSVTERIQSLQNQKTELEASRQDLERIIIQTPQIQRELIRLNRDYENYLQKYEEMQRKEMEAGIAENMEAGSKAERFRRVEQPIRPEKPIRPDRKKIVAMGFLLAIASSVGLTTLLEMGDKRIRGVDALASILNERPLVAIPYISINDEIRETGRTKKWLILLVLVSIPVVLACIHYLYMPLDLLLIKIVAKYG
jgi:uncharacterized protein involved in exopolysaccharide biosynthesis